MQKSDKLKIIVSSNMPTENALKSFHNQLYKLMLNANKKKTDFTSDDSKAVKIEKY
ncbi:hypothetical protein KQI61_19595 [Anaerocolumna aminovalerica]|uniref:hypothetical protein n=1 Tax=Anaerocolumna aminovalerica TaxID=1527 RepID=UPI001C0F2534|nr:hypothetical protein [Anaerocolumna aminovalerica]MBU5334386.1 hypothetical protein [Anaerocolumna aminovalerica]